MSQRSFVVAALVLGASAFIPTDSPAQLGKLTKKATSAAASAAGVSTTPARTVDAIDLTSAQLKQINAGLAAEIAATPTALKDAETAQKNYDKAQEKYNKDYDAYQKADEKWEACKEKVIKEADPSRTAAQQKVEKAGQNAEVGESEQAALEKQAMEAQAAAERIKNGTGTAADQQTLANFQKTMASMGARGMGAANAAQEAAALDQAVVKQIEKTCGGEPVKPVAPKSPANSAAEQISAAGAAASGLPNWVLTREKGIGYAASNTQVKGGDKTPQAEADAINAELATMRGNITQMQKAGTPM
jgi:hypothetical protein